MIKLWNLKNCVRKPKHYHQHRRWYSTDDIAQLDNHFEDAMKHEASRNTFPSAILRSNVLMLEDNLTAPSAREKIVPLLKKWMHVFKKLE